MIAAVGDTHLRRDLSALPARALELLCEASAILHVGDFVGTEVLRELESLGPTVFAIRGNCDESPLQERLPLHLVVRAEELIIGLVHDAGPRPGRDDRLLRAFSGCGVIVYGHTHMPEARRVGQTWILNPGSPTQRRRSPHRTIAVIEAGAPRLVVV